MDDFEEKLSRARIEDEDGAVDWLRGQVTFKRLKRIETIFNTPYCLQNRNPHYLVRVYP